MNTEINASSPLSRAMGSTLPATKAAPSPEWDLKALGLHDDGTPDLHGFYTPTDCAREMNKAIDEFKASFDKGIQAAIKVGHFALTAKELLPHGQFIPWLDANVKGMSGTWVRVCMRAASSWDQLADRADRLDLLIQAGSVERVAAMLPELKEGATPEQAVAKVTAPKATGEAKADKAPPKLKIEPNRPQDTLAADLAAKESKLKRWEADLIAWEQKLNERERLLSMREAHAPAPQPVTDAVAKTPVPAATVADVVSRETSADAGEAAMEAARAAMAKKGAAKLAAARQSAQNGEGKGRGAGKGKNGSGATLPAATIKALDGADAVL